MPRIVRFHKTGGPEVLQIEDLPVTPPAAGEVQIKVHALGLNRAESMFRSGQYLEVPQLPARLGYEAAGTITAVSPDVTGFNVGEAVSTIPNFSMRQYGAYGELVNMPASAIAKHPANLSFIEAAAVWMQYLTPYGALIDIADVKAGEFVLITAASSSVGLAAIEIANMLGAIPVALTRRSSKRDSLLKAGAKYVIATEEQDLVAEVNRITDGKGARIIFDPVGGPTLNKLADAAATGGIIFLYGALSPEPTPLPLFAALGKQLTIRGYILFELTTVPERLERAKAFVIKGLAEGSLKPVIDKTFPLERIVEAHRYMESNQQIGKIVVTVE
ncbi:MAG TPA: zinc-dependent alcohol dehydrogenase family protein [Methylophilaceae bacterium]|nr:zinc-dependent alcohol dehydrogenase family protein [Methylophilaceae bacterium]